MRFSFRAACRRVPAILATAILASSAGAQEQSGPAFRPGALLTTDNTNYLMSVSSDKQAGIVIFDGLEKQLDGIGAPLFATRPFSISMPLEGAEKGVKIGVIFNGYIWRLKGTDISLITTVNGQTSFMDFAKFAPASGGVMGEECKQFGSEQALDVVRRKVDTKYSVAPKKPAIADTRVPNALAAENDGDFLHCILLDVRSASDLRINVVFALHRHNRGTSGYLNVTTISALVQSGTK